MSPPFLKQVWGNREIHRAVMNRTVPRPETRQDMQEACLQEIPGLTAVGIRSCESAETGAVRAHSSGNQNSGQVPQSALRVLRDISTPTRAEKAAA